MHFMPALDSLETVCHRHEAGFTDCDPVGTSPASESTTMATTKALETPQTPDAHAATAVLHVAERLHSMNPEWVVFFREVLGVDGIVRRTFSDPAALLRFECSPQYARIREMLDDLRSRQRDRPANREAQRVVTVRMPRSLHESLKAEADDMRVSINSLCISKLLKILDEDERRDLAADRGEPQDMAG
jgi:predicted HicB family RNase H-like nuclease